LIYPSADQLEERVDSRYTLVVLAAKRAKQLREGAPKLLDTPSTNPLTIALEEIAAGKVTFDVPTTDEVATKAEVMAEALPEIESAEAEAAEITAEPAPVDEAARVAELLRLPGEETAEPEEEEAAPTSEQVSELLAIPEEESEEAEAETEEKPEEE
jgi:DNA-directed RNA polymerase subunit omega